MRLLKDIYNIILYYNKPKHCAMHNNVVRDLVVSLYKLGYTILNYDHITLSIRKTDFPLYYRGKKYDIVVSSNNYIIFIEVKTVSKNRIKKGKE